MNKTIAFTGHRKYPNTVNDFLKATIKRALDRGINHYISGLASGIDQKAIHILHNYKTEYPKIHIVGAKPFDSQGCDKDGTHYYYYAKCLKMCDEVILVSEGGYHISKYYIRNKWMVDNADYIISVLDNRGEGGALQTTKYALAQQKQVYRINSDGKNGWIKEL